MSPIFSVWPFEEFPGDLCPIYVTFDNCFYFTAAILGTVVIIPSSEVRYF